MPLRALPTYSPFLPRSNTGDSRASCCSFALFPLSCTPGGMSDPASTTQMSRSFLFGATAHCWIHVAHPYLQAHTICRALSLCDRATFPT